MSEPEPLVVELSAAFAGAGGKARGLARLLAAGLPVPPGFALTGAAFRAVTGATAAPAALDDIGHLLAAWAAAAETAALPPALAADVTARAAALGGPLIVRSSMALEDAAGGAAPGVGRSLAPVAAADVWPAIRAVWAASVTPLVALYARAAGAPAMAMTGAPGVVVERWWPGVARTVFTRPPGRPGADEVWIDAGDGAPRRVARATAEPLVTLALAAERAIDAPAGADVELVGRDGAWLVVQARPLVHPPPRAPRVPPPPFVLAPLVASGRAWRRDVTHNPDPLSTAQAELCAHVERAGAAPFHLAVVAGHLYSAPRAGVVASPPPATAEELEARFAAGAATVERALAAADGSLAGALAAYLAAYRVLTAELAPMIAAARAATAEVAALAPRRPSSLVAAVAAAARGALDRAGLLARVGDSAPAWDVACPTFAETPALLDAAIARAAARPPPPPEPPVPPARAREVALARAAADAAERDDVLFARAQATVRRALLAIGARHGLAGDDVFWLPFDELDGEVVADEAWRVRAAGRAGAARRAAARAAGWAMPLVPGAATATADGERWRGAGLGGIATGPAARFAHLGEADRVRRGAIVVTAAVTPALALLIEGAAAIVCEHGSLLDHGAAMARELGIPCVVGCAGVLDAVVDGEWLEVDGDAGQVSRVD